MLTAEVKHDSLCYDVTRNYKSGFFGFYLFLFFWGGGGSRGCKWHHEFRHLEKVAHTAVYSSRDSGSCVKFQQNSNFSYVALTARHYLTFSITMI
jgi:hypothetical protein